MKLLLNLIILIILNIYLVNCSGECTSYIDLQSSITTSPCGDSSSNACQNFELANKTCNIKSFDKVNYYFSAGQYNFTNTIGYIYNKSVNIYNTEESQSTVIFDLSNALDSFFILNYNLDTRGSSTINVNGITFINGNQSSASVLVNYGNGNSEFNFINCVFDNCTSLSEFGGVIGLLKSPKEKPSKEIEIMTLNIQQSVYKNVYNPKQQGSFIYAFQNILANINIDSSSFTAFNTSFGSVVHYQGYQMKTKAQITNSKIYSSCSKSAIFIASPQIITNLEYFDNVHSIGIGVGGGDYSVEISNSRFYNNINNTMIWVLYMDSDLKINNITCQDNILIAGNMYGNDTCINIMNSNAYISNSQFINNTGLSGTAINVDENGDSGFITIDSCYFDSNSATYYGGAVWIGVADVEFKGNNVFKNNKADYGAAILCDASTFLIKDDMTFINNTDLIDKDVNGITCGNRRVKDLCIIKGTQTNICAENGASQSETGWASGFSTGDNDDIFTIEFEKRQDSLSKKILNINKSIKIN